MITNLIKKIFPDNNEKFLNKNTHLLTKINEHESKLASLSDKELSEYSHKLSSSNNSHTDENLIIKSFSLVRETSHFTALSLKRCLDISSNPKLLILPI